MPLGPRMLALGVEPVQVDVDAGQHSNAGAVAGPGQAAIGEVVVAESAGRRGSLVRDGPAKGASRAAVALEPGTSKIAVNLPRARARAPVNGAALEEIHPSDFGAAIEDGRFVGHGIAEEAVHAAERLPVITDRAVDLVRVGRRAPVDVRAIELRTAAVRHRFLIGDRKSVVEGKSVE